MLSQNNSFPRDVRAVTDIKLTKRYKQLTQKNNRNTHTHKHWKTKDRSYWISDVGHKQTEIKRSISPSISAVQELWMPICGCLIHWNIIVRDHPDHNLGFKMSVLSSPSHLYIMASEFSFMLNLCYMQTRRMLQNIHLVCMCMCRVWWTEWFISDIS